MPTGVQTYLVKSGPLHLVEGHVIRSAIVEAGALNVP